MGYELRDHTADVAVAATGETLEDVFAAVADGLAAASCDDVPPAETDEDVTDADRFSLSVTAERREALLFDYLDEVIYLRDVRGELPVDHRVDSICGPEDGVDADRDVDDGDDGGDGDADTDAWRLEASARGVPLAAIDAREVKAVTYSEMELRRVDAASSDSDADADVDADTDAGANAEAAEDVTPSDAGWTAYVVFDV